MLFNLATIEEDLRGFQQNFSSINDGLAMRREDITDTMVNQIVEAYGFLNDLLRRKIDLFTPAGLHSLLEINHIVLCGKDPKTRRQYYQHLTETRAGFVRKITPIKQWVLKKRASNNPYKLATGFYSRMLSQPQLFLEGNHRTGNILLNYLLLSKQAIPYVISTDTAKPYLDLSGDIKFSDKGNSFDATVRLPGHSKRFRQFLESNASDRYIVLADQAGRKH